MAQLGPVTPILTDPRLTVRRLTCCVCGEDAGRFMQHWNRDTGWGCCRKCIDWQLGRGETAENILSYYGVAGVNYESR